MTKAKCPHCGHTITLENPHEGSIVACSKCGEELEIVKKDPLTFDLLSDWQEEDDTW